MKEQNEHQDPMRSTRIAYALVLRTNLEELPALKADLESIFERHRIAVLYQTTSVGFLKIVEESFGRGGEVP